MYKKTFILSLVLAFSIISCSSGKSTTVAYKKKHVSAKPVVKKPINKENQTAVKRKTKGVYGQEVLQSTSKTVVTTDMVHDYVVKYSDIAMQNMKNFGIPASIILAQGVLESGSGKGDLSSRSNNHFGIKCHKEWEGESVLHDDDAVGECFRKYKDPEDSYNDHAAFLTSRPRYASLFQLPKDDYKGWAKGLRAAGYATDPGYPQKLIGLIERYQLYKYDYVVLGKMKSNDVEIEVQPYKASVNQSEVQTKPKSAETVFVVPEVKKEEAAAVVPVVTAPTTEAPKPAEVVHTNDATFGVVKMDNLYKVEQGNTLYSISRMFKVTVAQLMDWNKLIDTNLVIGQILKVK